MQSLFTFNSPWFLFLTALGCLAAWPFTAQAAPASGLTTTIPISDSNVQNGLSPLNWVRKSGYVSSAGGGSSLKVAFQKTRTVALQVDPSVITTPIASRFPVIAWTVNGGALQTHQLQEQETAIPLASGVANPVVDLYLKGFSPYEERFTGDVPANVVKITGFTVEAGGKTAPVAFPGKVWLTIGDSILSGDAALYAAGQGRPPNDLWPASDDARASYGYLLAQHYGYREARLAYGGYDWGHGKGQMPALSTLLGQITSTVSRLTGGVFQPNPEVVLINLGENGAPRASSVTDALTRLRSRIKNTSKIIVMIPVSGKARAEVTAAFQAYKSAANDPNAFLVDLGSVTFATADGQHPTAAGHQAIYQAALPIFDKIVGPPALR